MIDDCSREVLDIEIDYSLPGQRVIRLLDKIGARRGYPRQVRSDNGPEFICLALADWTEEHGIHLEFTEPGKPTQNALIERFNRTYREEVLDAYVFNSLDEVRFTTDSWKKTYNEERPHASLGDATPEEIRQEKEGIISTIGLA